MRGGVVLVGLVCAALCLARAVPTHHRNKHSSKAVPPSEVEERGFEELVEAGLQDDHGIAFTQLAGLLSLAKPRHHQHHDLEATGKGRLTRTNLEDLVFTGLMQLYSKEKPTLSATKHSTSSVKWPGPLPRQHRFWQCDDSHDAPCKWTGRDVIMGRKEFEDAMELVQFLPPLDIVDAATSQFKALAESNSEVLPLATLQEWLHKVMEPNGDEMKLKVPELIATFAKEKFQNVFTSGAPANPLSTSLGPCDFIHAAMNHRKYTQKSTAFLVENIAGFQEYVHSFLNTFKGMGDEKNGVLAQHLYTLAHSDLEPGLDADLVQALNGASLDSAFAPGEGQLDCDETFLWFGKAACSKDATNAERAEGVGEVAAAVSEVLFPDLQRWRTWITANENSPPTYAAESLSLAPEEFVLLVNFALSPQHHHHKSAPGLVRAARTWQGLEPNERYLLFELHDFSHLVNAAADPGLDICEASIALDSVLSHHLELSEAGWESFLGNAFRAFRLVDRLPTNYLPSKLSLPGWTAWAKAFTLGKEIVQPDGSAYDLERISPKAELVDEWVADHSSAELLFKAVGEIRELQLGSCVTPAQIKKFLQAHTSMLQPDELASEDLNKAKASVDIANSIMRGIDVQPKTDSERELVRIHTEKMEPMQNRGLKQQYVDALISQRDSLQKEVDTQSPEGVVDALVAVYQVTRMGASNTKPTANHPKCLNLQDFKAALAMAMTPYEGITNEDVASFNTFLNAPSLFTAHKRVSATGVSQCSCYTPELALLSGCRVSGATESGARCAVACESGSSVVGESCVPSNQDKFTFWAFVSTVAQREMRDGTGSVQFPKLTQDGVFEMDRHLVKWASKPEHERFRLDALAALTWEMYTSLNLRFVAPKLQILEQDADHWEELEGVMANVEPSSTIRLKLRNAPAEENTVKSSVLRFSGPMKMVISVGGVDVPCEGQVEDKDVTGLACPLTITKHPPHALMSGGEEVISVETATLQERLELAAGKIADESPAVKGAALLTRIRVLAARIQQHASAVATWKASSDLAAPLAALEQSTGLAGMSKLAACWRAQLAAGLASKAAPGECSGIGESNLPRVRAAASMDERAPLIEAEYNKMVKFVGDMERALEGLVEAEDDGAFVLLVPYDDLYRSGSKGGQVARLAFKMKK